MSTGSFGWVHAASLFLVLGCNSEKKPEVPPPPVPDTPVASTTTTTTTTTTTPTATPSAPPSTPTAPVPSAVTCNSVESKASAKRDTKRRESKIVGGKPSVAGTWPYAVALAVEHDGKLEQYCGASLIGKKWVLTAAHCQVRAGEKAIVGRRDLSKTDGEVVSIARVRNHAGYDDSTNDNDVAVLELAKEVSLEAVTLGSTEVAEEKSTVIGWGYVKEGGPASPQLREVEVPVVSNTVCSDAYASDSVAITSNMLCAGLGEGGKDSCQGDSGGALLVKSAGGKWAQAGVVSFGIGCARPKKYGVYTRVSKYVPWIEACTKE